MLVLFSKNSEIVVHSFLEKLNIQFNLKKLGLASTFLGINILHTNVGFMLTQHQYILDLLQRVGLEQAKPILYHVSSKSIKTDFANAPMPHSPFFKIHASSLQYLTIIRPNISFIVNQLSQHMYDLSTVDFQL